MQRAYYDGLAEDGVLSMDGQGTTSMSPEGATQSLNPFDDLSEFAALGITTRG